MKITQAHYNQLESLVNEAIGHNPEAKARYRRDGLSMRRWRWDMMWQAVNVTSSTHSRAQDARVDIPLYAYLNDDHIDTALRKITNTR